MQYNLETYQRHTKCSDRKVQKELPMYYREQHIAMLYLDSDGDLSIEFTDDWFENRPRSMYLGDIPRDETGRITSPAVNCYFDRKFLPATDSNYRIQFMIIGEEDVELTSYKKRSLLFVNPLQNYALAIGAPAVPEADGTYISKAQRAQ